MHFRRRRGVFRVGAGGGRERADKLNSALQSLAVSVITSAAIAAFLATPSATKAADAATSTSAQSCIGGTEKGWAFKAEVSDDDGLVLKSARLGPRLFAAEV